MFERNPLCPLGYPCGNETYVNYNSTCQPFPNTTNDTDYGSGYDEMMYGDNVSMMEPQIPRGFRVCNQPNTALWSLILCLGTFVIAVTLRKLRHSKFFGKKVH